MQQSASFAVVIISFILYFTKVLPIYGGTFLHFYRRTFGKFYIFPDELFRNFTFFLTKFWRFLHFSGGIYSMVTRWAQDIF